jgi:hypothetical protein
MGEASIPSRLRWRLRAAAGAELSREQRRDLAEACLRIDPELSSRPIAPLSALLHQMVGSPDRNLPLARCANGVAPNAAGSTGASPTPYAILELERDVLVAPAERPPRRAARRSPDGMAAAVFAATPDLPVSHFIGWAAEVHVDALFEAGEIYGVTIRRVKACGRPSTGCETRAVAGSASTTPGRVGHLQRFGASS